MRSLRPVLLSVLLTLMGSPALAQTESGAPNLALQAEAGSLGFGLSLAAGLNEQWQARLALRGGDFGYNFHAENSDGVRGDELRHHVDADLRSASLLLDFYPGAARQFFVSSGLIYNDSHLRSRSTCSNAAGCEVGDGSTTVPSNAVITGHYQLKKLAPYLGLGWGNPLHERGWSWRAEAGAAYIGKADVSLAYQGSCGSGIFTAPGVCQQQVDQEAKDLQEQIRDYRFYPLLQLSLAYAF